MGIRRQAGIREKGNTTPGGNKGKRELDAETEVSERCRAPGQRTEDDGVAVADESVETVDDVTLWRHKGHARGVEAGVSMITRLGESGKERARTAHDARGQVKHFHAAHDCRLAHVGAGVRQTSLERRRDVLDDRRDAKGGADEPASGREGSCAGGSAREQGGERWDEGERA